MPFTSHKKFNLTDEGQTESSAMFSGRLSDCRKLAYANGMEEVGHASRDEDTVASYQCGGKIDHLNGDRYWLTIPLRVWNADV